MKPALTVKPLAAEWVTSAAFEPFGQLIVPSEDGQPFSAEDAQLSLDRGIPRFYIMRLPAKGLRFSRITRHQQCTQCLGALNGKDWLMAVAPPSETPYPDLNQLMAFRISGDCFIKLHVGTWHAGPYFEHEFVDFYNLELSDTNLVDHQTHDFAVSHGLEFQLIVESR
ncbi:ureidoglycolate lyase [Leptolyngbya sp. AN02str]|uniref:ureidoglycolate lyase n=1 Tax=Leptolyngbya sp. AN02str TaxID=3423363 RepID=UPI003D322B2D